MIIFHHNDADGRCAAAIVNRKYKGYWDVAPVHFREMDYKMPVPLSDIQVGETVVIVDFSFKPNDMAKVIEACGSPLNVIWCDHHATAKGYGYDVAGLRDFTDKGRCGAECAWDFFFPNETPSLGLALLGDYDSWRLRLGPDTFAFYEGLKLENQAPDSSLWKEVLDGGPVIEAVVAQGKAALKYRDLYCGELRKAFGYETVIGGHRAYALNAYRFGSGGFGEIFKAYPVCIAYIHDGAKFTVSLYSETVDVSEIAKQYGGGGHKGAAGFVCNQLPWIKPKSGESAIVGKG